MSSIRSHVQFMSPNRSFKTKSSLWKWSWRKQRARAKSDRRRLTTSQPGNTTCEWQWSQPIRLLSSRVCSGMWQEAQCLQCLQKARTWLTLLVLVLVRAMVMTMRKSLRSSVAEAFRCRESRWGLVAHLHRLLSLLVNRWQEMDRTASRVFSIQSYRECGGHQAQCERRVISLQECVPPPCVSRVANLDAPGSRCADFSMCSDAECVESARDPVPVVAGDSLSLFSPCEVFSLFSEWMPGLSCDLRGIKLHKSTLAALMIVETRPFVPCCATYIF